MNINYIYNIIVFSLATRGNSFDFHLILFDEFFLVNTNIDLKNLLMFYGSVTFLISKSTETMKNGAQSNTKSEWKWVQIFVTRKKTVTWKKTYWKSPCPVFRFFRQSTYNTRVHNRIFPVSLFLQRKASGRCLLFVQQHLYHSSSR